MKDEAKNLRLMCRAEIIRRERLCNIKEALHTASKVENLIEQMLEGTVTFTYVTQYGKTRKVRGTLIRYRNYFNVEYNARPGNAFVPYYDLDINKWRTFHASGLISLNPATYG